MRRSCGLRLSCAPMKPRLHALGAALGWVVACAVAAADGPNLLTDLGGATGTPPAPWRFVGLPQQTKPLTQFRIVDSRG